MDQATIINNRTLNVTAAISITVLLILLFLKLNEPQLNTNLSGVVLGGSVVLGLILASAILAGIIKLTYKKISLWTAFLSTTAIAILIFYVQMYFTLN